MRLQPPSQELGVTAWGVLCIVRQANGYEGPVQHLSSRVEQSEPRTWRAIAQLMAHGLVEASSTGPGTVRVVPTRAGRSRRSREPR